MKKKALAIMITYLLFCVLVGALMSSCATLKNDEKAFFQDLVYCAKTNSANTQIAIAALSCIDSVAAQSYAQCLLILPPIEQWGNNEVRCVAMALSLKVTNQAKQQTQ